MTSKLFNLLTDRIFWLYTVAVTTLILLPAFILLVTTGSYSQKISWSIPFFIFYLGSIHLFFIGRDIFVKKESLMKKFKHSLLIFTALSLVMAISSIASMKEGLLSILLHVYLLAFLYSWNPILLSMLFLRYSFPINMLSVLLILSVFAFYELGYLIVMHHKRARLVFIIFIVVLSFSAAYYYTVGEKGLDIAPYNTGSYLVEVTANPILDGVPVLEILRLNGIEAKWEDRWEHGPLLINAEHEEVSKLKYLWINSVSPFSHQIASNSMDTALMPTYFFGLFKENSLWIALLLLVLYYIKTHLDIS